jgi:hypothetical protein
MYFMTRADWSARPPDNLHPPVASNQGVKIHYLGDWFIEIPHFRCQEQMRAVQNQHMDDNGWADIGYNLAVCQHGVVFEGRGKNAQNAANGNETLNRNHFAVLVFTAKNGYSGVTQACITGIQDAIAYLRRHGAGWEIAGHRDGYSTECPGNLLYGHVLNGTLDPGVLWDGGTHIVKAGETLGTISLQYNVPKAYIIKANGMTTDTVVAGQRLDIPARGVPFGDTVPPDTGTEFTPFPGTEWFKSQPHSPIITAMGQRLVAEGCGRYSTGPGPQWSEKDRESYKAWQIKLGFSGTNADGWPGATSWEQLRVPYVGVTPSPVEIEPFPGIEWFKSSPVSPIVTAMGERLVAEGCGVYTQGPGPAWSDADRASYKKWQEKLGYTGADADGWPGQSSWYALRVHKTTPAGYEPYPGAEWFKSSPVSPIVTAMGERLVAEGCGVYTQGPGPAWSDADRASYKKWQEKLGYTGADADGWPGRVTWDRLKVPRVSTGNYEAFPGTSWFQNAPYHPLVTKMGERLVAEGCSEYEHGPGPQWTDADRASYRKWQQKLGYTGTAADGWPGPTSWDRLRVPK